MINIIGATHPGMREHNEDCFAADSDRGIGLVADGMGGYACGEVASELVKQTVVGALNNNEGLREAIARAHAHIKVAAKNDANKQGMGSTVIALKVLGMDYEIAWVGDSRAYLWDGSLKQITRDHSYVENLLAKGAITQIEAINHPNRNLITQAVGVAGQGGLEINVIDGRLQAGQKLLLCSDGLVDEVVDRDIARLINDAVDEQQAVNNLIKAAVVAGGRDNITVLIATADANGTGQPAILPEIIRTTCVDGRVAESFTPKKNKRHYKIKKRPPSRFVTPPEPVTPNNSSVTNLIDFFRFHNQVILGSIIVAFVVASVLLYLS